MLKSWVVAVALALVVPLLTSGPAAAEPSTSMASITGTVVEQDSGERISARVGLFRAGEGIPSVQSDSDSSKPFRFTVSPGTYYLCTLGSAYVPRSCTGGVKTPYAAIVSTFRVEAGQEFETTLIEVSGNQPYRLTDLRLTGTARFGETLRLEAAAAPKDAFREVTWFLDEAPIWAPHTTQDAVDITPAIGARAGQRIRARVQFSGPSGTTVTQWVRSAPIRKAAPIKVLKKGRIAPYSARTLRWGDNASVVGAKFDHDTGRRTIRWWVGKKAMPRKHYNLPLKRWMIGKRLTARVKMTSPYARPVTYRLKSRGPVRDQR